MKIAVIGLGKLGAPLAANAALWGHDVIGVDLVEKTVKLVNDRKAPVNETGLADLMAKLPKGKLTATSDITKAVACADMSMLVVPTPSMKDWTFDNQYILDAIERIGPAIRRWHTVVVVSTVMPGSMSGVIKTALEAASQRTVGKGIGLVYSPEFIALGRVLTDLQKPDMIFVGADDDASRDHYMQYVRSTVPHATKIVNLTCWEAEVAKLALNCYVTMKISFANMLGEICDAMGVNGHNVAAAIGADSRIGSKYIRPGGPYGGTCFPRDTWAMQAAASQYGVGAPLVSATEDVNQRTLARFAEQARNSGRKVAVLGLTFKPDTAITEHSLGMYVARYLVAEGVDVVTHDPMAIGVPIGVKRMSSAQEAVDWSECVLIATPWPEYVTLDYGGKKLVDPWGISRT